MLSQRDRHVLIFGTWVNILEILPSVREFFGLLSIGGNPRAWRYEGKDTAE